MKIDGVGEALLVFMKRKLCVKRNEQKLSIFNLKKWYVSWSKFTYASKISRKRNEETTSENNCNCLIQLLCSYMLVRCIFGWIVIKFWCDYEMFSFFSASSRAERTLWYRNGVWIVFFSRFCDKSTIRSSFGLETHTKRWIEWQFWRSNESFFGWMDSKNVREWPKCHFSAQFWDIINYGLNVTLTAGDDA